MSVLFSNQSYNLEYKLLDLQNYFGWSLMRKYITKKHYDEGSSYTIKVLSLFTLWFSKGIPSRSRPAHVPTPDRILLFHRERGCDIKWLNHPYFPKVTVTGGCGKDNIKNKQL